MKSTLLFSILAISLSISALATAQGSHIVTTAGGVQRLAVVEPTTTAPRLVITAPAKVQGVSSASMRGAGTPTRVDPTERRYSHHEVSRLASMPQRITNSALNTATRTTEYQLNSAIRREIRRAIQF